MFDCNLFEQYLACLHSSAIQNDLCMFKQQGGTTRKIDEADFEVRIDSTAVSIFVVILVELTNTETAVE